MSHIILPLDYIHTIHFILNQNSMHVLNPNLSAISKCPTSVASGTSFQIKRLESRSNTLHLIRRPN